MAKKWDGDSTSAEKLLLLFATLLFNRRAFSLTELSSPAFLNASKPTVSRLLRQLEHSGAGMLIHEKRGRESWYSLERRPLPSPSLNEDGIAMLALCRDLVLHLLPERVQSETANILARLGGRSDGARMPEAASIVRGRVDYAPFQDVFERLERAIRKKLVCRIRYRAAGGGEVREHAFAPMRLLCSQEAIYIEGWLLESENPARRKYEDALRLPLQRFQACEATEFSSAKLPAPPPLKNDSLGLLEQDSFTARIWFAKEAAGYVAERCWSRDQAIEWEEDGSLVLAVRMANFPEALSWVLGFGRRATVLEPVWFARKVREELKEAARNYGKKKSGKEMKTEGADRERQEGGPEEIADQLSPAP